MGLSPSNLRSESLQCLVTDPEYLVHAADQHRHQPASARDNPHAKLSSEQMPADVPLTKGGQDEQLWLCTASLLDCHLCFISKGQLELRTSDLIFRDESYLLTWPLECLRWYGANAKHFIFESGRRSPYGPGLFIFKCKQSKKLSLKLSTQIGRLLSCMPNSIRRGSVHLPNHRCTARPSVSDDHTFKLVFQTKHPLSSGVDSSTSNSTTDSVNFMLTHPPVVVPVEDSTKNYTTLHVYRHPAPNPLTLENSFQLWYPLLVMSSPLSASLLRRQPSLAGNYLDWLNPTSCSSTSIVAAAATTTTTNSTTNTPEATINAPVPGSDEAQPACFGEYLIAVAVHPYVNQTNLMLLNTDDASNQHVVESALSSVTVVDTETSRS